MEYVPSGDVNMKKIKRHENISSLNRGGDNRSCCIIPSIGKTVECIPDIWDIMEELTQAIEKCNVYDIPDTLNPNEATDIDVGLHAYFFQRHSISYIEHNLRSKRRMVEYKYPYEFYPPNYNNFSKAIRLRELSGAGPYGLKHDKQAILTFSRAFGISDIKRIEDYRLPVMPNNSDNYEVPYPYTVSKFSTFKYYPNIKSAVNKFWQSIHFHNFMIGPRAPSELTIMKCSHVNVDGRDNGFLSYPQPKRHGKIRTINPCKAVLSSSHHKSLKNYIDNIRPRIITQFSKDYLYVNPIDGRPFTPANLGKYMRITGKMVYSSYKPYDGRHWCAIAYLIKTKIETGHFDYYAVNRFMGHTNIQTTMNYVGPAMNYYDQYPHDWYGHALKSYKIGKRDFPNKTRFLGLLGKVSPEKSNGLVEI